MRVIPTYVHGIVDYLMGIVLIAAPWLLGFADGGAAMWTPIVIGAGVIAYSLLTDYELGVAPTITMSTHLILDAIGGVILAASPWLFQFADAVWVPHVVVGLGEILAAAMTQTVPQRRVTRA
jgi:SPW repeat